jgi:hypothetical protein
VICPEYLTLAISTKRHFDSFDSADSNVNVMLDLPISRMRSPISDTAVSLPTPRLLPFMSQYAGFLTKFQNDSF